jgi:hypothetical protein
MCPYYGGAMLFLEGWQSMSHGVPNDIKCPVTCPIFLVGMLFYQMWSICQGEEE